jgi:glutaminase
MSQESGITPDSAKTGVGGGIVAVVPGKWPRRILTACE